MQKIDAVWEKRNLGVDTVEIIIEQNDTADDITAVLGALECGYAVVKLPASRPELISVVQNSGFYFAEDMVRLVSNLKEPSRSSLEDRFYKAVLTYKMTEADMKELYSQIKKGLFGTDRIVLDPHFTQEQAQLRYINWIADEYSRGTSFYKYVYKGNAIGFFALREKENGHYTSFIGGIYPDYRKGGIGTIVKVPETVRELGGKSVDTHVSTNNPAQIRNLISNGYMPEEITHTFVKHIQA